VVGVAYDLIGLKPKSSNGLCVRLNIWKWYEFVRMINYFNIISDLEISSWMTNDQIELSNEEAFLLSEDIKSNLDNFNHFINEMYKEDIPYSHMPWHREVCCPILNGSDVKYVLLFLESCGGFKVR
jgi:hypothetical protein